MAPVVSDATIWADLSARIDAHNEIVPVSGEDDLPLIFDMVAEHHNIDRDRVKAVYLARTFMVGAG